MLWHAVLAAIEAWLVDAVALGQFDARLQGEVQWHAVLAAIEARLSEHATSSDTDRCMGKVVAMARFNMVDVVRPRRGCASGRILLRAIVVA
jgi:hypothetical protein